MTNLNSAPSHEENNLEDELKMIPVNPSMGKKSSFRWWLVFGFFFLVLMTGTGAKWWLVSQNQQNKGSMATAKPQAQALPVKIETLGSEMVENSSTVVGTLDASRAVTLESEVRGRVNKILVKEGMRVKAGQVIVTVESDDLQAELFQAKAVIVNAQARLTELKTGNRPEDIAKAKAQLNQAIARLDNAKQGARPEEIAQAQAQVDSAQAELDLAQERVKRYGELEEQGAISEDQFAEYVKIERQASASLREAQRRLEALTKGRQADVSALEASVEEARQNLRRLENGARVEEIAQAEANVAQAIAAMRMVEVKIKKTQIIAPFSGIVGDIAVKLGDYIDSGNDITTVTENNVLEVNLSVPIEQAEKLRLGLPVEILDQQGESISRGQINFISPDVKAQTQLVLAKAVLENNSNLLLNGGSFQTKIIWEENQGILVPASAVSRLGNKTFIFVAQSMDKSSSNQPQLMAKQKLVKLGNLQGNNYQVLEGLKAGEKIITAGIMNLRDNTPVMALPE